MNPTPTSPQQAVHVAVAVVVNQHAQILVSKRANHQHQGGLWEFPGGKVENGEPVQIALARELHEELNISLSNATPLLQVSHDYGDKYVVLDVWWVSDYAGEVHGNEGQEWQWADAQTLAILPFPAANKPILTAVLERLASLA
ncbi:8-oxo-dGTP diphosphatase MutT [Aliidiomarina sp.]|uniref:8-oxo-dGTP diphosphatase MutT n=1 Tax=Aliidiomarina sp. TaxID=1872439 RepID=UPI003A4DE6DF